MAYGLLAEIVLIELSVIATSALRSDLSRAVPISIELAVAVVLFEAVLAAQTPLDVAFRTILDCTRQTESKLRKSALLTGTDANPLLRYLSFWTRLASIFNYNFSLWTWLAPVLNYNFSLWA